MTGADVLLDVRDLLQDTVADAYRFSDASLLRVLTTALREMRRMRPDAFFIGGEIKPAPVVTAASLNEALPVDEQFVTALVYFTVGFAEMREDQFTQDSRAAAMLQQARNVLMAG